MTNKKPIIIIPLLTAIIFVLTRNPYTSIFAVQMTLLSLLILIGYTFLAKRRGLKLTTTPLYVYLFTAFILFLVATTGWFFSPFFFLLYFMAFILAFIFSPIASIAFTFSLVALFSFNIGQVDTTYDVLVILSLLTVIPITFYLRKEYLELKQATKDILILQMEKQHYKNKVDEILANKVTNFAVNMRQPINDAKQIGYRLQEIKNKEQIKTYQERIVTASEEALTVLRSFEEEVTGKKLHSSKETS